MLERLADCDLVIEAVYENIDIKKDVFGKLDKIAKPGAILASNTSYLNVDEIAAVTTRPDHVHRHAFLLAGECHAAAGSRARREDVEARHCHRDAARKKIGKIGVLVGVCQASLATACCINASAKRKSSFSRAPCPGTSIG